MNGLLLKLAVGRTSFKQKSYKKSCNGPLLMNNLVGKTGNVG